MPTANGMGTLAATTVSNSPGTLMTGVSGLRTPTTAGRALTSPKRMQDCRTGAEGTECKVSAAILMAHHRPGVANSTGQLLDGNQTECGPGGAATIEQLSHRAEPPAHNGEHKDDESGSDDVQLERVPLHPVAVQPVAKTTQREVESGTPVCKRQGWPAAASATTRAASVAAG